MFKYPLQISLHTIIRTVHTATKRNFPLIIFDGECNFCNSSVDFIISQDKQNKFKFLAGQSPHAKRLLQKLYVNPEISKETMLLIEPDNTIYYKGDAAIRIAKELNVPYSLLGVIGEKLIPDFLKSPLYDVIAKNREKWFGKRNQCRMPTEEDKQRFLDWD